MNTLFRPSWSKRDIDIIQKYKQRIKDIEQQNLQQKLIEKDVNSIEFYNITPKEQLPKFLQKMKFQTLHSKQNVSKVIKVFKKERQTKEQANIRNKLKNQGDLMFLSEIYQSLGQPAENKQLQPLVQSSKFTETFGTDLEQWQKTRNNALLEKLLIMRRRHPHHSSSPRYKQSRIIEQKLSQLHRNNSSGRVVNYFKQGSNYKKQIQKQLDIIYYTHSSQSNQVNKCLLIQNSSKLLKKQLDERQVQVQEQIKSKLKILNETRIQHHNLFEEKSRLFNEEKLFLEELSTKEQYGISANTGYFTSSSLSNSTKMHDIKNQKRQQIQQLEMKILKNKRLIQGLQSAIQNSEQQLRSIMLGEISYYKQSLKIGMDCRDTGLGWIIRKLNSLIVTSNSTQPHKDPLNPVINDHEYEFPQFLDKKSKEFLVLKTILEEQLELLMEQKRKFVNEIGQHSSGGTTTPGSGNLKSVNSNRGFCMSATSGAGWTSAKAQDKIVEDDNATSDIPKKYRRSLRKITILNQEYAKNQSLIQLKQRHTSKGHDLSTNTEGLSGKRLYQSITQKIKFFDFTKAKKDKSSLMKNSKLMEYQNLLKSIKDIHIKLEDLDMQHENHLTSHYKESKEVFFEQCAACFGYKKSYSMIIKYFSWKNAGEEGKNAGHV